MTDIEAQTLILAEVGAGLDAPDRPELNILAKLVPTLWVWYADKATTYPRLQYLFTKRHAIDILLGQLRNKVSFSMDGVSWQLSNSVTALQKLRGDVEDEITRVLKEASANRMGTVAYNPNTGSPAQIPIAYRGQIGDPTAPGYRGDPLQNLNNITGNRFRGF